MISLGVGVGILIVCMMLMTSRALDLGPPGLTFAFQNTACVVPAVVLSLIFGAAYGFRMTPWLIIGTLVVILGLFWATRGQGCGQRIPKRWFFYSISMLLTQAFILSVFQWRCLLTAKSLPEHPLIPFTCELEEEKWFMVGLFLGAAALQTMIFILTEKRIPQKSEFIYGILGGSCNGCSTYLLLEATKIASSIERSIMFPFFAISVIVLCNLWGQMVYGEKVAWPAYGLCSLGILLAAF